MDVHSRVLLPGIRISGHCFASEPSTFSFAQVSADDHKLLEIKRLTKHARRFANYQSLLSQFFCTGLGFQQVQNNDPNEVN